MSYNYEIIAAAQKERERDDALAAFNSWRDCHTPERAMTLAGYIKKYNPLFEREYPAKIFMFWYNVITDRSYSKVKNRLIQLGLRPLMSRYEEQINTIYARTMQSAYSRIQKTSGSTKTDSDSIDVLDSIPGKMGSYAKEFIREHSLEEMINEAKENPLDQRSKHLIALAVNTRFRNKGKAISLLLQPDNHFLLEDLHPNTFFIYRSSFIPEIVNELPNNMTDDEYLNDFPYGIDISMEGKLKVWLEEVSSNYLIAKDYKGAYLIASKLLLDSEIIKREGIDRYLESLGLTQKQLVDAIITADKNTDLITLAQFFEVEKTGCLEKNNMVASAIARVKAEQENGYDWLVPINELTEKFNIICIQSRKNEKASVPLNAARFAVFGAYGVPNNDEAMMSLLRIDNPDEYQEFKRLYIGIKREKDYNPLVREWLEAQRRVREKKEGN